MRVYLFIAFDLNGYIDSLEGHPDIKLIRGRTLIRCTYFKRTYVTVKHCRPRLTGMQISPDQSHVNRPSKILDQGSIYRAAARRGSFCSVQRVSFSLLLSLCV